MILLDFEAATLGLWSRSQVRVPSRSRPRSQPAAPGRALGAMNARWYAAINRKVGEVLALKELLDFDDGKRAFFIAGPSLIETHAVYDERAERVANVRLLRGNTGS